MPNTGRAEPDTAVMVIETEEFIAIAIMEIEPENQDNNLCPSCLGYEFCLNLKGSKPFAKICSAHTPNTLIEK